MGIVRSSPDFFQIGAGTIARRMGHQEKGAG
jgi:hypothetical protein